jgi:hypothetical protein
MTRRFGSAAALALAAVLLLAGCGSGSSATAGEPATGPTSSAPATTPIAPAQLQRIRLCLKTAGLGHTVFTSPGPSDGLSGSPIGKPTSGPGGPGTFPAGGIFSDPHVAQALKACGISFPTVPRVSVSPSS